MIGYRYTTDNRLPSGDMEELADALAIQLHGSMGQRVYLLSRYDIIELISPYIDDLVPEDQRALSWMVWHLFQEAREMEQGEE